MRLDLEGRDPLLIAAAVVFGAAAIVLQAGGSVLWIAPLAIAAVLVARSSRDYRRAAQQRDTEYNEILAELEQRDAAERAREQ